MNKKKQYIEKQNEKCLKTQTEQGTQNEGQTKEKYNAITEGVIWKQLAFFFFPILVGIFFQQLYNMVDTIIVGRFVGKEALSSVGGSSGQIVNLVVGFFTGISTGASVIVAQFFGARNEKSLEEALHTSYTFAVSGGIVLGIVGIIFAPFLLRMMKTPEILMENSTMYLRIYFAGMVFVLVYNFGSAILRAIGDTKKPLYFLMICCVINIVLDLLLVVKFHMGVKGVAIATLVSQAVSAVLVTLVMMYRTTEIRLDLRKLRINRQMLMRLLFIGLPTGIQSSMFSVSNMIIQAALNGFGVDTMAAWVAFGKVDGFFWMINNAFGMSITTFVGQNYGAGKWKRISKAVRLSLVVSVVVSLLFSLGFMLNGSLLLGIFTTDSTVIQIGIRMMRVITPSYFLFEFIEIFSGTLRAEGHVMVSTIMVLTGTCLVRIVWVTVIMAGKSLEAVIACYPLTWGICAVMFIFYYIWKQRKILEQWKQS